MVMTLPDTTGKEAFLATANVPEFTFDHAVEQLSDLTLLDAQQENLTRTPRYALHPQAGHSPRQSWQRS